MDDQDDDLEGAYALTTPEDAVRYYRGWAGRYDSDFAADMSYRSPEAVAELFAAHGGGGPVLDVGTGTGLVAEALARHGVGPVDGVDISPEMLAVAATKGILRQAIRADLTRPLPLADEAYQGVVSAGTFTHGHVGPEVFAELLRVTRSGGLFVVTVHEAVYESGGFAGVFARLAGQLYDFATTPFAIYGADAAGDHAGDSAWLVSFRKRAG